MAATKDQFSNRSFVDLTQSAANVLTFQQIRFAVGVFQGIGLLLHRIEWFPIGTSIQEIAATSDNFQLALTLRDDLANLDPSNQSILATVVLQPIGALPLGPVITPIISDFSSLPGGGLLIPANPLFLAMDSAGFAAVGRVRIAVYYTFMQLSDREAMELLQTIIPGNV